MLFNLWIALRSMARGECDSWVFSLKIVFNYLEMLRHPTTTGPCAKVI